MECGEGDDDELLSSQVLGHPDEGGDVGVVDVDVVADAEESVLHRDSEQTRVVMLQDVSGKGEEIIFRRYYFGKAKSRVWGHSCGCKMAYSN